MWLNALRDKKFIGNFEAGPIIMSCLDKTDFSMIGSLQTSTILHSLTHTSEWHRGTFTYLLHKFFVDNISV